ncbi:MAG: glycosyltransferase [Elainella sp.]
MIYSAIDHLAHADAITRPYHPPVTVLQSLADGKAPDSFCQQDYPAYQIIFAAVRSEAAVEQIQRLQQRYPNRDISLVTADSEAAAWTQAVAAAKSQLLVFADSQTRVAANYLQQLVLPFRYPSVGVVTSFYRCRGWLTCLSAIADLYPAALLARCRTGIHFTLETNLAIRKALLTQLQFDNGNSFWITAPQAHRAQLGYWPGSLGYRTVLSRQVVDRVGEPASLAALWRRLNSDQMLTHSIQALPWKALRILQYGTVFSLLLLILLGGSPLTWTLVGLTWTTRWLTAWIIGLGCLRDRAIWRYGWLLPLYDWVSLGLWCSHIAHRLGRTALAAVVNPAATRPLPLDLAEPGFNSVSDLAPSGSDSRDLSSLTAQPSYPPSSLL